MAYLPKDYSRHENKIMFGLSLKSLLVLLFFAFVGIIIAKASFIHIILKIVLIIPLFILAPLFVFYKTVDGDDLMTYIFNLILYYSSPKYLVYKKQHPAERREHNGKKV